jgi:2-C-methyl-D-erythritol 2,4-cyclodiphosphate synthase
MRVGIGYDIHRTEAGKGIVLGGVEIASPFRLVGHSDADVVLHAIMDALLGASALGDIGKHFPPTDERFRGVSSVLLLAAVRDLVRQQSWSVVNVDVTVVAEQPRLRPHIWKMRCGIADALEIDRDRVGVKATTNENVGPEGRGEAISAHAVALLESQ